jgi:hypothetical protein
VGQVDLDKVRKVVVFLPPTMGDCVNHLATLRWLRDGLPGREIYVSCGGLGFEVLRTWPVEGVTLIERENKLKHAWLIWRLSADMAFFPYVQNGMLRLARWSGMRWLVGLKGGKHDDWFTESVNRVAGEHQVLDLCRRLFGAVGIECGSAEFGVSAPGICDEVRRMGLMTGASRPDKQWSIEKFKSVAVEMRQRGFSVVNLGGIYECHALGDHADEDGTVQNFGFLTRENDLWPGMNYVQNCEVIVTNDTGLMHLAGAMGTPVVGIFMVESPEEYYPPGEGHELLRGDVSVEDVLAAVDRILERTK